MGGCSCRRDSFISAAHLCECSPCSCAFACFAGSTLGASMLPTASARNRCLLQAASGSFFLGGHWLCWLGCRNYLSRKHPLQNTYKMNNLNMKFLMHELEWYACSEYHSGMTRCEGKARAIGPSPDWPLNASSSQQLPPNWMQL